MGVLKKRKTCFHFVRLPQGQDHSMRVHTAGFPAHAKDMHRKRAHLRGRATAGFFACKDVAQESGHPARKKRLTNSELGSEMSCRSERLLAVEWSREVMEVSSRRSEPTKDPRDSRCFQDKRDFSACKKMSDT